MLPEEVRSVWNAFGLNSQAFPAYYAMGPVRFIDANGEETGEKGARARVSRSLSNSPHMLMGIRIQNVINFAPNLGELGTSDTDVAIYESARKMGDEQVVRINLSQQNISADAVLQSTICGTEGQHWHPFPAPFPMAGGNEIEVEITRTSSYPSYSFANRIIPEVHVTLLAAVLRSGMPSDPLVRRNP